MAILYYTTQVDASRTLGQIQAILAKAGARGVSVTFDGHGEAEALSFAVEVGSTMLNFQLPSRWQGVHAALKRDGVAARYRTEKHARRVAWRIVKNWVEVQMALIEAGLAELPEVFLPYALNASGQTFFESFKARQLTSGGSDG